VVIVNSRGRIIRANAAAASLFGFEEHEINGMSVRALFPGRPPIYRTVREALANVRQHARASTVTVELLDVEDGCLVRIVDDGVGYDPADVEDRPGHLGLALIRERAELAGGWYRIERSPGSGTTVEFWVPFGESSTEPEPGHELAG
jgi:signal transduction histidine kinase